MLERFCNKCLDQLLILSQYTDISYNFPDPVLVLYIYLQNQIVCKNLDEFLFWNHIILQYYEK